jgi:hypothetical protein
VREREREKKEKREKNKEKREKKEMQEEEKEGRSKEVGVTKDGEPKRELTKKEEKSYMAKNKCAMTTIIHYTLKYEGWKERKEG